jgi:hypothetical protein
MNEKIAQLKKKSTQLKTESIYKAAAGVVGIARVLGEVDEGDKPVISNPTTRGNLLYGLEELGAMIGNQAEELGA